MERDLYAQLLAWKSDSARKPLLLHGARQVGKTYLIRQFGTRAFENVCYLNFEEDPIGKQFFEGALSPEHIIQSLNIHKDIFIEPQKTLIIFDEIQECPAALTSLKYFNEKAPEYAVIAAGSLLGVKLSQAKGFPVGNVNFLDLYPLTFLEFLDALGKSQLRQYVEASTFNEPILEPFHQQLITLLREYFFVGGMPEAVKFYAESRNFIKAREVQKEILKSYLFDFSKHAPASEVMKITMVWESIPAQLAKENKKFIFSALRQSARGRDYENALQWLIDAGLIHPCYHVSAPRFPLKSYADKNIFKIYLLDIGLLGAMAQLPSKILLEGDALFTEFKGSLTENFAAQSFKATRENGLFYWTSSGTAEVDFLISQENNIIPVEIKAGSSVKSKSLAVYQDKYKPTKMMRASLLNMRQEEILQNFPLYFIPALT